MNLYTFATRLGWNEPEILPRLRALALTVPCGRCEGKGHIGFERTDDTICFRCRGDGDVLPRLTRVLAGTVAARVVRGDLNSYYAERRRKRREDEILVLLGKCRELWQRITPTGVAHPRFAEAQVLSREATEAGIRFAAQQIDLVTARDALEAIKNELLAIWLSCRDARSA